MGRAVRYWASGIAGPGGSGNGMHASHCMAKPSHRIGQLDGLRALAVTAVFIHHAFHARLLWAGVDLFFLLSGFLITGILVERKGTPAREFFGHFYDRRIRRIVPALLVMLLLVAVTGGYGDMRLWVLYLFMMNVLIVMGARYPLAANSLWSLSVEEQFYLAWPVVVYLLSETALTWVAGGLVIAVPLLRWFMTPLFSQHWAMYMLTPFRMDLLAVGSLIAVAWRHRRQAIERYGAYGLLLTAGAVAALGLLSRNPRFNTIANTPEANVWIYECSLIGCTGILLWTLSGRGVGALRWAPLRYLGRISYSIYLIHELVLFQVRHINSVGERGLIAAAVSLGYAVVMWHFVEQPLLLWKPRSRVRREAVQDEDAISAPSTERASAELHREQPELPGPQPTHFAGS